MSERNDRKKFLEKFLRKIPPALFGLVFLIFLFSSLSPYFLSFSNFLTILLQSSILLTVALGMTIILISGGIDLSLGAFLGLMGVITVLFLHKGEGIVISVIMGIGVISLLGIANGFFIGKAQLPPFIVTFGMMGIAQSFSLSLSKGSSIPGVPSLIQFIGMGSFLTIPVPVWIAVIVTLVLHFLLSNTSFGIHIYGIGANEESAILSGINVERCKIIIYFLAALLTGIGGLITIGRMNSAHPTVGIGMEFDAIAAAVMGGTSLFGGVGRISGTVVGVLLIGTLRNGLDLMMIPSTWQISIIGVIILTAVIIDAVLHKKGKLII